MLSKDMTKDDLRRVVFVPQCGVSGDMLLGCLVDLGGERRLLEKVQRALQEQGEEISFSLHRVEEESIQAVQVAVKDEAPLHGRTGKAMVKLMEQTAHLCGVSERVLKGAMEALGHLLEAEARVHGSSVEEVHLHEAASGDTVFDMLGFFLLLESLGFPEVESAPVRVGGGYVQCAHGMLPVPVPAVTDLLVKGNIPCEGGPVEEEIATPTGVAILLSCAQFHQHIPPMTPLKVGVGRGTKNFDVPNVLRAFLVSPRPGTLWMVETGIDDATGEEMGYALEKLDPLTLEVSLFQGVGKKGRPFFLLRMLVEEACREKAIHRVLALTPTLGVRFWQVDRVVMERTVVKKEALVEGKPYPFRVKISSLGDLRKEKAEFEDIKDLLE